MIRLTVIITY